jgi:hypothetical protein
MPVTLAHLPDYTAHTENISITTTTLLALFKATVFLYSDNQAKYVYRDLQAMAQHIYIDAACKNRNHCGWKFRGSRLVTIQTDRQTGRQLLLSWFNMYEMRFGMWEGENNLSIQTFCSAPTAVSSERPGLDRCRHYN